MVKFILGKSKEKRDQALEFVFTNRENFMKGNFKIMSVQVLELRFMQTEIFMLVIF